MRTHPIRAPVAPAFTLSPAGVQKEGVGPPCMIHAPPIHGTHPSGSPHTAAPHSLCTCTPYTRHTHTAAPHTPCTLQVVGMKSFRKYLPGDIVGFLLESKLEANLAVIQQTVTVMFLDIENFTDTVEAMSNEETVVFYGDVMTLLTMQVIKNKGTLDKYIGDCIMAFWNMPQKVPNHETLAVYAALDARAALPEIHEKVCCHVWWWGVKGVLRMRRGCVENTSRAVRGSGSGFANGMCQCKNGKSRVELEALGQSNVHNGNVKCKLEMALRDI